MGTSPKTKKVVASLDAGKYANRIQKTDQDRKEESLGYEIAQAENNLDQGILAVKGQLIAEESNLNKSRNAVTVAQNALEKAKDAVPFDVQRILNARAAVLQAEANLETQEEEYQQLVDAKAFLEELKVELF
jgi:hypothetical protein